MTKITISQNFEVYTLKFDLQKMQQNLSFVPAQALNEIGQITKLIVEEYETKNIFLNSGLSQINMAVLFDKSFNPENKFKIKDGIEKINENMDLILGKTDKKKIISDIIAFVCMNEGLEKSNIGKSLKI